MIGENSFNVDSAITNIQVINDLARQNHLEIIYVSYEGNNGDIQPNYDMNLGNKN